MLTTLFIFKNSFYFVANPCNSFLLIKPAYRFFPLILKAIVPYPTPL
jgi:hypothetical protein